MDKVIEVYVSCVTDVHYGPHEVHYNYTKLFSNTVVAQQWIDLQPKFSVMYREEIKYLMRTELITSSFTEEELQTLTRIKAEKDAEIKAYREAEDRHYQQQLDKMLEDEPTAEDCWDGDSSDSD